VNLHLIGQTGVALVVLNIFLDQIGVPIPGIPTLIVAGAIAGEQGMPANELFAGSLIACIFADSAWYLAGRRYGNRVMKVLCRVSLTPDSCVSQTQLRFERLGAAALIVAKFIPGLTLLAPPLAGAIEMSVWRFVAFSAVGDALWVGIFLGTGILFKSEIAALLPAVEHLGSLIFAILGALLAAYIAYKWWERRRFYTLLRMARIEVSDLYRMMDQGSSPLILDVRSATARKLEPRHIPGAISLSLDDIARELPRLPRDREIVLYCTCPNEASAAQVARVLLKNGFARVRPLRGGLDEWIQAGYAVETAPTVSIAPKGR
jgi:membrane protein DedA with SNARE-associated domain/rhodanese-related sulfurtransferase